MNLLFKVFNDHYFRSKKFEQNNKIYNSLGIPIFKKLIMRMVKNKKVRNYNLMQFSISGLKEFEYQSRINEIKHIIIAILMIFISIGLCCVHSYIKALLLLVMNIILNIYPICLQRYNRIRINKILNNKILNNK